MNTGVLFYDYISFYFIYRQVKCTCEYLQVVPFLVHFPALPAQPARPCVSRLFHGTLKPFCSVLAAPGIQKTLILIIFPHPSIILKIFL